MQGPPRLSGAQAAPDQIVTPREDQGKLPETAGGGWGLGEERRKGTAGGGYPQGPKHIMKQECMVSDPKTNLC